MEVEEEGPACCSGQLEGEILWLTVMAEGVRENAQCRERGMEDENVVCYE